jgi:hypothetical protein
MMPMKKLLALALFVPLVLFGRKFYDDDPLAKEPPPLPVENLAPRKLNDFFDAVMNTLGHPGEGHDRAKGERSFIPAGAVNTLGEVPDSAWFTNRIGSREMSVEEAARGPRQGNAPAAEGVWVITGAKTEGVTPGFFVKDSAGKRYVLKFDPPDHPEMATGAEMIGTSLFHDLGYNVPENYLVTFTRDRLAVGENTRITDDTGRERPLTEADVDRALRRVRRDGQGRYRALASFFIKGKLLDEFRYHGTRADDPNDIVRHEHRRDLRGLFVFAAWVNHNDSRAINTKDSLVEENGVSFVKHFLIDFGATLGSASVLSNSARDGNTYFFSPKQTMAQIFSLGLYVPEWARSDYIKHPALGQIEYPRFEPEEWKPNYPNPAFVNRLPDDTYWAAKKVMSFSSEQIRAIVQEAQYSDPEAAKWITTYLTDRRDIIGQTYFAKVLPLDGFKVDGGKLAFEDLQVKYGLTKERNYQVAWSLFDNSTETLTALEGESGFAVPAAAANRENGAYFAARIDAGDKAKTVTVYLRKSQGQLQVVGIDRTW